MSFEIDGLPLSVIAAVAKRATGGATLSKEAKAVLQRSVGIFIVHLAAAANDVCRGAKRSTISGADALKALADIDMEEELAKPASAALDGAAACRWLACLRDAVGLAAI